MIHWKFFEEKKTYVCTALQLVEYTGLKIILEKTKKQILIFKYDIFTETCIQNSHPKWKEQFL